MGEGVREGAKETFAVVVGLPALARVIAGRSVFGAVLDAPAGAGLHRALATATELRSAAPEAVAFLISDRHDGAAALAQRLARVGHPCAVVTTGPDLTVNDALLALSRSPAMPFFLPDDDGDVGLLPAAPPAEQGSSDEVGLPADADADADAEAEAAVEVEVEAPASPFAPPPRRGRARRVAPPEQTAVRPPAKPRTGATPDDDGPPEWLAGMTEAGPPPVGAAAGSPGDGDLPGGASRGATPDDDGPPEWLAGVGGSAERVAVDEPRTVATPRVQLPDLGELPEVPGFEDRPDPVWELQLNRTDWPKPRVLRSGEQPRVIAFTVPKGGTGKTASAAYGAVLLAGAGHRVLYVDANTQQADGSETFDVAATAPTIYDLTNGEEVPLGSLSREAVQQILTPIIPEPGRDTNLFAMFGPRDPRQANPLIVTPALYLEALEAVEDQFDYVVVDSPIAESWRDIISDFILPKADFVAIVVTPSWPTVSNTYKWLTGVTNPKYAAEWAYPAQQVGWFFNRWEDDIDFDQQTAAEALANWRFLGTIPDFKSVRRANNRGAIPDDVEYNVALAKVFFEITRDPALEAAIESYAPRQRGSFRRVRGR